MLDAAKFGEGAQAAVAGIARIGFAVEVVAHLVAVVGAEEETSGDKAKRMTLFTG